MRRVLPLIYREIVSEASCWQPKAFFSTETARALVLREHGPPEKVLRLEQFDIPSASDLKPDEVIINILAVCPAFGLP